MSKKSGSTRTAPTDGTTQAPRERAPRKVPGPLDARGRLTVAARIAKAVAGIDPGQQRGIVGVASVVGPENAGVLRRVLSILAGVHEGDRRSVLDVASAALPHPLQAISRVGDDVTALGQQAAPLNGTVQPDA
jgi:hypothetical protein